jgi:hypothetical protein
MVALLDASLRIGPYERVVIAGDSVGQRLDLDDETPFGPQGIKSTSYRRPLPSRNSKFDQAS